MPRFNLRKTFRLGPLFWRFSKNGFTSWGFKIGSLTRNVTRGTTTYDTPGPGSWTWGGRKGRR